MICEFCGNLNNDPNPPSGRRKCCGAIPAGKMTGRMIGSFRILAELGRGNRGVVYLARQLSLDRLVALKLLAAELKEKEAAREEFLTEAKLAAKLNFPNIVHPIEAGEADGEYFFAMEFIRGETVEDRLVREKRLPVEDICRIALAVADALDCAWRKYRMIHGDIKPANILLAADGGNIKLADFGLASIGGKSEIAQGTPLYAAPELICPEIGERDFRADIYSLGIMLYELAAGEAPFSGDPAVILENHLHLIPPPVERRAPELPLELASLINRMVRKTPTARPRSWREVAETIRKAQAAPFRLDPPRPSAWAAMTAVALASLALGLAAGYFLVGSASDDQEPAKKAPVESAAPVEAALPKPVKSVEPPPVVPTPAPVPVQPPKPAPAIAPLEKTAEAPKPVPKPKAHPRPRPKPEAPKVAVPVKAAAAEAVKPVNEPPQAPEPPPEPPPKPVVPPGVDYFQAAKAGDVAVIRRKLVAGVDVNATDANGYTALMFAAFRGHEPLVRFLLAHGADRKIRNQYQQSAADLAPDRSEVQRLLLAK